MERIYTLIDKLSQQKHQGASPAHMLFTVQLLQQELLRIQKSSETPGTKKVAVTLPFHTTISVNEDIFSTPVIETLFVTSPAEEKEIYVLEMAEEQEEVTTSPSLPEPETEQPAYSLRKPAVQELLFEPQQPAVKEESRPSYLTQQLFNSAFDSTTVEVPTLVQFKATPEVHERLAEKKESLNDYLKQEKTEVAHALKETPIKDLRKGIGINDRFAFVRELFRGDEAAYERSIKTINGFGIYSEAEYWMSRELKLKLGWDERAETVQHFYQLVRRRFS